MRRRRAKRAGWILIGDERYGSARIQGYNIHKYLIDHAVDSVILRAPEIADHRLRLSWQVRLRMLASRFDTMVFQKVFDADAIHLARLLRLAGVRTVFVLCDLYETKMITAVDRVIVTSSYLRDFVEKKYGIEVALIDDAIELGATGARRALNGGKQSGRNSTALWVGSKDNWEALSKLKISMGSVLAQHRINVVAVSDHCDADVPWSLSAVAEQCAVSDFAIIPTKSDPWALAKSSNRLSMYLSQSLPVIASPIPSYCELGAKVGGVRFAESADDWASAFGDFVDSDFREKLIEGVAYKVRQLLDLQSIGPLWRQALRC